MSIYYTRDCGHSTLKDAWKTGADEPLSGLCYECLQARIGERIEFVRHGKPPSSGTSTNHRESTAEDGVSVYEVSDNTIKYCGWHFDICERSAYRGFGTITGWGSDGEPLVKIISING